MINCILLIALILLFVGKRLWSKTYWLRGYINVKDFISQFDEILTLPILLIELIIECTKMVINGQLKKATIKLCMGLLAKLVLVLVIVDNYKKDWKLLVKQTPLFLSYYLLRRSGLLLVKMLYGVIILNNVNNNVLSNLATIMLIITFVGVAWWKSKQQYLKAMIMLGERLGITLILDNNPKFMLALHIPIYLAYTKITKSTVLILAHGDSHCHQIWNVRTNLSCLHQNKLIWGHDGCVELCDMIIRPNTMKEVIELLVEAGHTNIYIASCNPGSVSLDKLINSFNINICYSKRTLIMGFPVC